MCSGLKTCGWILWMVSLLAGGYSVACADWPQFMRDAGHSGKQVTSLQVEQLGLLHQVHLEEMVLTSPVVRSGRVYVVDQMGTAYAIEIESGEILWRSAIPGEPLGGNTSSPAILENILIYGTTAGQLCFVDLETGQRVREIELGWSVVSSLTVTEGHVLVATIDASVHKFDALGNHIWTWDHYRLGECWHENRGEEFKANRFDLPHFGGAAVAASGNLIFAPIGYDLVCLEDLGEQVQLRWKINKPVTQFDAPQGVSTDGEHVYCTWPKSDGEGAIIKHRATDGKVLAVARDQWAVPEPPAWDDGRVVFNRHAFGVVEMDFHGRRPQLRWQGFGITQETNFPAIAAPALTSEHAVLATLTGDLQIHERSKQERFDPPPAPCYRFRLPTKSTIGTSAPALSDGKIFFGSDEGCLYILGPVGQTENQDAEENSSKGNNVGPTAQPTARRLPLRSLPPEADAEWEWPSAFGGPGNTSSVITPTARPPYQLRWAMRDYSLCKHPVCTSRGDLVSSDFSGLVVCRDQASGRIHWRRKISGQAWSRATLLCADGKVFVPRVSSPRYAMIVDQPDALYVFDQTSGELLWSRLIGRGDWLRASPVYANGVVAYGSKYETPPGSRELISAAHRWQVTDQEPADDWWSPEFDNSAWETSVISNDGRIAARRDAAQPTTLYLRTTMQMPATKPELVQLGVLHGPADEWFLSINGQVVHQTAGWESGNTQTNASYTGVAAVFHPLDLELPAGEHTVAIGLRRARMKSNVSSSSSVCPPRLIMTPQPLVQGAVIDAWDANTGQLQWSYELAARGDYIEGPAGCTDGNHFYFTGGGTGTAGKGLTLALDPVSGSPLWSTSRAYSCRTGTPAISGDKLILPGALHRPLAALALRNGELLWENDSVIKRTQVHAPSVLGEFFTVNTKYVGGAKCWLIETGESCVVPGLQSSESPEDHPLELLDLASEGHTCGTIVLLQSGYAVAATNKGITFTDLKTGEIVATTPGFASQTCPHPVFAGDTMFYVPQNSGMLFCFEPKPAK